MQSDWIAALVPQLATGLLGYAAARLAHRAKTTEVTETTATQVQIARIEAGTATETHLWDYLKDANERHEKDIERLRLCDDKRRDAESKVLILRTRLAQALVENRRLKREKR